VKIVPEDIESYTMQFKFNMPVLLSAYPSSQVMFNYEYDDAPHPDSHRYRWAMTRGYMFNYLFSRKTYMDFVWEAMPDNYHYLINDYDQDHAVILGEGAKVGISQSIMMKPPNVQPVFPIRDETNPTLIDLDSSSGNKGPIFIVNTESNDQRSPFTMENYHYLESIFEQLTKIKATFKSDDFDVVVLYSPSSEFAIKAMTSQISLPQMKLVPTEDPFNIKFTESTLAKNKDNKRMNIWIS